MKLKTLIPLAILALVLGGIYGYYQYNRSAENPADMAAAATVVSNALIAEFEQDENGANAKYNGKTLEVSGNIRAVAKKEDGSIEVILAGDSELVGVSCVCTGENAKAAEAYKAGDAVVAKGTCTGILSDVILSPCSVTKK